MFQCDTCGIRLQFHQNYLHHVQTGQVLQCANCDETFDSLCAVRSHRRLVHPREFEEGRGMMQDTDTAVRLCPRQDNSNSTGDSAHNNVGNENIPPHSHGIAPIAVETTGSEDSKSKIESGYQPLYSPRGRNFSIPVLKPDKPEIKNGGDLIDLSGQDKKPSDLDKAVEALIESIRKRTQQQERPTPVNPTKNSMQSTPPSTIPHQVKNNGHSDVKFSGRMQTTQPELGMNKEEARNTSDEASQDSSVSTRFYTPQSENSDRIKRAKHSETKQSEGLPIAGPKYLCQYHQAPEPTQQGISGGRIVCFECETTFSTILGLQHHQIMYEHNYCKLCLSFFNDRSLFQRHIQLIHNFKCMECQLTYKSWEERGEHQRLTGHGYCKDCGGYFLDRESYAKHLPLHKSSTKFACPICKASFTTEESRNMHQGATKHAYCDECGCCFRDQASHAKHGNVHKAANFICPTCGAGFVTEECRDAHQRENNHGVCSRCEKVFADRASEKSHSGVAHKHKCPVAGCKHSFPTCGPLETHKVKSHHICILCDRKFVDRLALLTHERTSGKHAKKGAAIA
ncbi:hypothetical protein EMPG_11846 [Blastomyces silverae]|uniref:C2H2-type domain-containing protein n=1 Tax=Blastomyces silverae TaxID=2060906 RepID=A0A0H1BQ11_9EURO|nr:hypothetical protein EMPG_11846 [Blastomyces silverae]